MVGSGVSALDQLLTGYVALGRWLIISVPRFPCLLSDGVATSKDHCKDETV